MMSYTMKEKTDAAIGKYKDALRETDSFDGEKREIALKALVTEMHAIGYLQAVHQDTKDIMMVMHQRNHRLVGALLELEDDLRPQQTEFIASVIAEESSSPTDLSNYPAMVVHDQIHHTRKFAEDNPEIAGFVVNNKLSLALASGDSFRTTFPTLEESADGHFAYTVAVGTVSHEILTEVKRSISKLPQWETLIVPQRFGKEDDRVYHNPDPHTAFGYVRSWYLDEQTRTIYADITITDLGIKDKIMESGALSSISLKPRFTRDGNTITRCIHLELTETCFNGINENVNLMLSLKTEIDAAKRLASQNTPEDAPLIIQLTDKSPKPFYGYGAVEVHEGLSPVHRLYMAPHFIDGKLAGKVVQVLSPKGEVDGQIRFEKTRAARSRTIDALLSMVQFALVDNVDQSDSMKDQVKSLIQELREFM